MKLTFPDISRKDILPAFATLLFLAAYLSGVWYVKHLDSAVRAQAAELAAETGREASLRSLSGFLDELRADESRLSSFFTDPEDAVRIIEDVERLEDAVGIPVSISGVHLEDENTQTGEGTMVMDVTAEGPWEQMTKLLTLLGEFPEASFLDSAMLRRGEIKGGDVPQVWSLRAGMRVMLRK